MAEARLGRYEVEAGNLPAVCMRCGEPVEVWIKRTVKGTEDFRLLKAVVVVPLCHVHRNHWRRRVLFNWVFIALVLVSVPAVLLAWDSLAKAWNEDSAAILTLAATAFLLTWAITNAVWSFFELRIASVTDRVITIEGVSQRFIDALKVKRLETKEEDAGMPFPSGNRVPVPPRKDVRLTLDEANFGDVPMVCVRCGGPAAVLMNKELRWRPMRPRRADVGFFLLGILGYLIVSMAGEKGTRTRLPFCERHKHYWRWRSQVAWFGFSLAAVLFACAGIIESATQAANPLRVLSPWMAIAGIALAVVWAFVVSIMADCSIRMIDFTDESICLIRVSPQFSKALEEYRKLPKEE